MEKIKVGFPGKYYTAKRKGRVHRDGEYKMRVDSAIKLLKARNGWLYNRARDFNAQDRTVRSTDSKYSHGERDLDELTMEDIKRIEEKANKYSYRANVIPSEGKIKIWSNALGSWHFVHPKLKIK